MIGKLKWFLLALILLLTGIQDIWGQERKILFHEHRETSNIDFHSFYPRLILRYKLGPFYKLPKNPLLTPSPGSWDGRDVADPYVVVRADSIILFYDGDSDERYHIGYAVLDPSGWFWEKRGMIFSGSGAFWDSFHQIAPVVVEEGSGMKMYYNGNSEDSELGYQFGLAILKENRWISSQLPPIMGLDTSSWDFSGNIYGDVVYIPEEKRYRLWYSGFQGPISSIGMAESSDGIHWKKRDEPVLTLLPGVIAPDILFNGEQYFMFFVQVFVTHGQARTKIVRATSKDGIHWENFQDVLYPEKSWEGSRVMRPNLSFFNQRVYLYYCAQKGSRWQIGAAYCDPEFVPEGVWKSSILNIHGSRLKIQFERPEGTGLMLILNELEKNKTLMYDILNDGKMLREGVYEKILELPEGFHLNRWTLQLKLKTTRIHRTPVVYRVEVIP
ncbi:MAG: hypothetical protein D6748_01905 [Calditrichaeota bacterium]|nr:MAG: hypothetical protein D6748_01905 [Calditrichota bacterium]